MNRRVNAITLIELLLSIVLLSIIILGLSSIDLFSRSHVMTSDRRAKISNELSLALEHMDKNVMLGVGNISQPPLEQITNGFRVRVDPLQTPQNLNDDLWFNYALNGNTLSCTCTQITAGLSPVCPSDQTLSWHIIPGVVYGAMPSNPASGFYINLTDNYTGVEVGLVARYQPDNAVSPTNPQMQMKSKLYTHSSAAR